MNSELRVGGFAPRHLRRWVLQIVLKVREYKVMLKQFTFCLAVIGICASMVMAQLSDKAKNKTDEAQIKNVLVSFAAAWNAHDMVKFSELFTADADWVNIRGSRWKGVDEIRENHVAIHKRFYSESRLEFVDVSVRMITPDVAVIHAKEIVAGSNVPKEAGIATDSQMSLIVIRRGAKWLVTNGQNTNIAPPPIAK